MIEIDGEFFPDIDHDAELLRVENQFHVWTNAMKEVALVKVKENISALERCFGEAFIFSCAIATMGMIDKYPGRYKNGGVVLPVNNKEINDE